MSCSRCDYSGTYADISHTFVVLYITTLPQMLFNSLTTDIVRMWK